LQAFFAVLNEIKFIIETRNQANKLNDPTATMERFNMVSESVKNIDAEYKNNPGLPIEFISKSVQDLINFFNKPPPPPSGNPPPPPPPPPAKTIVPAAAIRIRDKITTESNLKPCKECGMLTGNVTKLCSGCTRKEKRRLESPIKKKVTAFNKEITRQERWIADRASMLEKARELEVVYDQKQKEAAELDALIKLM